MPIEPDQTKWVGIRPTPDCGDIPTTTRKILPAISDLAAVTDQCSRRWYANNQDCTVEKLISLAPVPAGEIWVVTNISMENVTSFCDMEITMKVDVAVDPFCSWYSIPARQKVYWNGIVVLRPVNVLRGYYRLGGANDDFVLYCQGWKIEEY